MRVEWWSKLLIGCGSVVALMLLANPLWDAVNRNLAAFGTLKTVQFVRDAGDCPELVLVPPTYTVTSSIQAQPREQYFMGIQALASGQPQRADELFSRLGQSITSPALDSFWLGCAAWRNQETGNAIQAWKGAGALPYFFGHADYAFAQHDYATALRLYQRAAALAPNSAKAQLGIAAALQNLATAGQARWQDALAAAEAALALAPEDPQSHYLVGYALWLLKQDLPRAEQELRWALARREHWADAYSLARLLLDEGHSGEPTQLLERAQKQFDLPTIRGQLVRAYLADGNCRAARNEYTRAVARFPNLQEELDSICARYSACHCT